MSNIQNMKKPELRAACKELGIKNYSKMSNETMQQAIYAEQAKQELVEEYGVSECPHCNIGLDNGVIQHGDEVNGKPIKMGKYIYECMGCGAEFGPEVKPGTPKAAPKTTGIKIEKNREEQNGVKRPSVGGACRAVWDLCDQLRKTTGAIPTASTIKEAAATAGLNANNASIELYQWRKFHGIRGRQLVEKSPK